MLTMKQAASAAFLAGLVHIAPAGMVAQTLKPLCHPTVSGQTVVATAEERLAAGRRAQPPLTDTVSGFAWPDTPLGVIKTNEGYEFFGSDGGAHYRQLWHGHWVGNDKSGSFVTTTGTLDNPLGWADPLDTAVSPNVDSSLNPNYPSYGYIGGGPVFQVPAGMPGAGSLLGTYHAELPTGSLYAALGLARSTDNGRHWMDLGEIVRFNQAFAVGLDGFEIGDGPLVLSPDGRYFYLYFPDWTANGTLHTTNAAGVSTTTKVSVVRAPVADVLEAAFGSDHPHAFPFEKFYQGSWNLQPGIGGGSTDLNPDSAYQGYLDIHYSSALQRYIMIISDDTSFGYAESVDGLSWTVPTLLGVFGPIAAYPTAVGLGDDPHVLGPKFYVYFTHLPTEGNQWATGSLHRLTLTCP